MCIHYKGKSKRDKGKGDSSKRKVMNSPDPFIEKPGPMKTPQPAGASDPKGGSTGKSERIYPHGQNSHKSP
ncbi:hypothetical protein Y032_0011g1382 [Ancylostoma ceylanicum]|uniref:Uncharacterized protein n=1 Tax=Ancylostoma ceylanicum TaxID=53326 RepID=A0A016VG99_9BILA|nr:hypothetical protein Y032_0011g1382 [Ancylostoma ceylanicum]